VLSGFRVLELTDESGFLAGKILGDLGADVIKVEPPGGDPDARRPPYLHGIEDPARSLVWLALNTSKRGITLDLFAPAGRDLFRRLLDRSDVLLDTLPPGALEALGLGWEALSRDHPRLVRCAITPFGQDGPYASYRAGDLVVVAMGGNASMTGDPDRPPVRCSMPTSYYHAGPEAALAIAMALEARAATGRGQLVDLSLQECQVGTLLGGPGIHAHRADPPRRSGARTVRTREIWPARDGHVSFGLRGGPARVPGLRALVAWMAEEGCAPSWIADTDWEQFRAHELDDEEIARFEGAFGAFFASHTMRALYEGSLERRILLAPCNDAREVLAQRQLRARGLFATIDYPELGASIEHPAFFAKSDGGGIGIRRRAPSPGEHNAEVYGELGIGPDALVALQRGGAI
jgi:benzylsuccinate CoA-transferase BbsE subunit